MGWSCRNSTWSWYLCLIHCEVVKKCSLLRKEREITFQLRGAIYQLTWRINSLTCSWEGQPNPTYLFVSNCLCIARDLVPLRTEVANNLRWPWDANGKDCSRIITWCTSHEEKNNRCKWPSVGKRKRERELITLFECCLKWQVKCMNDWEWESDREARERERSGFYHKYNWTLAHRKLKEDWRKVRVVSYLTLIHAW